MSILKKRPGVGALVAGQTLNLSTGTIPVGQRKTDKFPVLDLGIRPDVSEREWRLSLDGHAANTLSLSLESLQRMPRIALTADFHCVTRWSRIGLQWEGVRLETLHQLAAARPDVESIMAHGADGYSTNVRRHAFDETFVVDRLDGRPIQADHGGPVRLLAPKLYGWKSCKFLRRIEFLEADRPGFWEERGYNLSGRVAHEERYW